MVVGVWCCICLYHFIGYSCIGGSKALPNVGMHCHWCFAFICAFQAPLSSGKLIATDKCSCLGHKHFEELQVLKFAWHPVLVDHAAEKSNEVEELDIIQDFMDLNEEQDILDWEKQNPYLWVWYNSMLIIGENCATVPVSITTGTLLVSDKPKH